jgi:hypothetical protein
MPEPIFDSAAASGLHRILQGLLHFRQIIRMDFYQRVTAGKTFHRISEDPCVGSVIPHSSSLGVDYGYQIIDIINDQFQQPQISTKGPFSFIFHRVAADSHLVCTSCSSFASMRSIVNGRHLNEVPGAVERFFLLQFGSRL